MIAGFKGELFYCQALFQVSNRKDVHFHDCFSKYPSCGGDEGDEMRGELRER